MSTFSERLSAFLGKNKEKIVDPQGQSIQLIDTQMEKVRKKKYEIKNSPFAQAGIKVGTLGLIKVGDEISPITVEEIGVLSFDSVSAEKSTDFFHPNSPTSNSEFDLLFPINGQIGHIQLVKSQDSTLDGLTARYEGTVTGEDFVIFRYSSYRESCIQFGTLTSQERQKINEFINQDISVRNSAIAPYLKLKCPSSDLPDFIILGGYAFKLRIQKYTAEFHSCLLYALTGIILADVIYNKKANQLLVNKLQVSEDEWKLKSIERQDGSTEFVFTAQKKVDKYFYLTPAEAVILQSVCKQFGTDMPEYGLKIEDNGGSSDEQ